MTVAVAAGSAACTDSASAGTSPTAGLDARTIVALGDSLTAGKGLDDDEAYPAVLERMLRAAGLPFEIKNHGVSGDTSADAIRRLDRALGESPAIMIVALGANDGLRGVPVAQLRRNLETILDAAQARKINVLLCGMEALPIHGWEYTLEFHRLFPALAAKYNVPLVPFLLNGVIWTPGMVQNDHVHPNAAGAVEIARTIWPYLQPLAASLAGGLTVPIETEPVRR
jgi:acyl-CoA thioesterase-1